MASAVDFGQPLSPQVLASVQYNSTDEECAQYLSFGVVLTPYWIVVASLFLLPPIQFCTSLAEPWAHCVARVCRRHCYDTCGRHCGTRLTQQNDHLYTGCDACEDSKACCGRCCGDSSSSSNSSDGGGDSQSSAAAARAPAESAANDKQTGAIALTVRDDSKPKDKDDAAAAAAAAATATSGAAKPDDATAATKKPDAANKTSVKAMGSPPLKRGLSLLAANNARAVKYQCACAVRWYNTFMHPAWQMVALQAVLCVVEYIYVANTLTPGNTRWERYQEFVVRINNSALPAVAVQCMFLLLHTEAGIEIDSRDNKTEWHAPQITGGVFGVVAFLLGLPSIVTHVIPGGFVYCWVVLLVVLGAGCGGGLLSAFGECFCGDDDGDKKKKSSGGHTFASVTSRSVLLEILVRIMVQIVLCVMIQSIVNYAALLYSGEAYIDVISRDYNMRNTRCYFHLLQNDAAQVTSFITWL